MLIPALTFFGVNEMYGEGLGEYDVIRVQERKGIFDQIYYTFVEEVH